MRRLGCSSLLALLLVVAIVPTGLAQGESPDQRFGIGFQASFPAWGLSGMVDLSRGFALQGIFGVIGDLKTYAGRGILRFSRQKYHSVYGYGVVGAFSYTGLKEGESWYEWEETTETVVGFGGGLGFDYNWRAWSENLPPISWNLEIGIARVNFSEVDYNFSSMTFGAGLHYRF